MKRCYQFQVRSFLPSDYPVVHRLISWKYKSYYMREWLFWWHLYEKTIGSWILGKPFKQLFRNVCDAKYLVHRRQSQNLLRCQTKQFEMQRCSSIPNNWKRSSWLLIFLKNGKKKKKVWIVLYTCEVYRAIHLELVTALATDTFLQSFRRCITRRGRPTTVCSDNGTNFVGADKAPSQTSFGNRSLLQQQHGRFVVILISLPLSNELGGRNGWHKWWNVSLGKP